MIIGRKKEIQILNDTRNSDTSEFMAVYGRMGTGKTYLIRNTFEGEFLLQHSGLYNGSFKEQLLAFRDSLKATILQPTGTMPLNY